MEQIPILQIENVTKQIRRKTIIDNLSFEVNRGEVFGFLGPNGAGKTTLIRMVVGLMSITKGDIYVGGQSVKKDFEKALLQVGAIVENPEMYKYLSGYRNLIHYARMIPGITPERIEEVVELVGLKNRIHEKVKRYSLGMRQRLGVAQALLHKPSLLILDEPTNGLDPAGIRELRDYLRRLAQKENVAVVVSSHLLSEMELMCDRVAVIQQGRLINIQDIRSGNEEQTECLITFEVDRKESAVRVLEKWKNQTGISLGEHSVTLELSREEVAEANTILVEAGIKVYGIKQINKTLEDKFLEMTGSDQIA
ncbi:putative ABC transporter ATP-binding protein YhcH [Paenibacillus larvae subsp. larvae]|uniref:Putative ABC transporter ATP-binding protein YhcH n=1 Tax=Paenibacillus larvae subsp. larvae TaxID=147375 RepID=A0A2L1UIJ7_9BACL|nr:ABC transporter ATP-binding protein [Paenibacillus larvae]AQT84542.1 bacitracin ABC transporter ATP-binding protein [Paenibacillus larvae subsp. pulvifaciens]AQZ46542.1 bacitracin ABC transporter ATP-binding protein [Paenibacillus larvae subsp. pulvifaciens]AVF28259.1 putative ABC transporter ATP-binding protein YhcH [Paenibacillus larvae subsp. larvae]AVF32762.1 putative ABC transporter ATP-binding protein YhcH [Paenibacillus larvae subsp. larvae]MBH0341702.1 bacitracin ABC transporter ATP